MTSTIAIFTVKYESRNIVFVFFRKPFDVATLSTGEIVVTDYGCENVKVFSLAGVGRLIISGEFEYPRGVATSKDDLIFVLDSELGRVTVHSSADGNLLRTLKGDCTLKATRSLLTTSIRDYK